MTKKIVYHEWVRNQCWAGEYCKWECGCSEFIFFNGGPSFSRKSCDDDHEKINKYEKQSPISLNCGITYH